MHDKHTNLSTARVRVPLGEGGVDQGLETLFQGTEMIHCLSVSRQARYPAAQARQIQGQARDMP